MTSRTRQGWRAVAVLATFALTAGALAAAACGGTSSADKTATASAKGGGSTPAAAAASPTAAATQQAAAGGAAATVMIADTSLGKVLADDKGMTLYMYKNDVANSGKSACAAACLANWPALTIASGVPAKPAGLAGELAVITRDDGAMQVTYNGLPLYYFINDKAPGDTKGDGVAGIWSAARP
jgi:predicted lipoprotein with Yx(FWY)xxD motif